MFWWKRIKCLQSQLESTEKDRDVFKSRCKDLEDSIEKEFGVKIRKEITEIKVDFDKVEMSILLLALCKLYSTSAKFSTEDLQYYIKLRVKIEGLLEKMEE